MGLSNATFGLVSGFIVLPLPLLLAAEGVPQARIAAVSAACLSPGFWVFLLGPLLDVRFTRRWYAACFAMVAGVCLSFAVLMRGHLLVLELALMMAYAAAVLSSNALGGWLSTILPVVAEADHDSPNHEAARLGAWTQVGSFLGGGAMAGLSAEGLRLLPLNVAAILLGLLVMLPAAVFPFIPALPRTQAQAPFAEGFRQLLRELKLLLKKRDVLLTLLLFVAPTGAFALTNQLGGVARDFHASEAFVSRMGGVGLSLAGAGSCLLLPLFARFLRPLPLYLTIGTVGSLFTLTLLLMPRTPAMFAVAFLAENVAQALSFTAAVSICFATIGSRNPLAATQFSLLTSATVLPILYMGVLDGNVYTRGLNAMYLVDGALSLAACTALAVILRATATAP